MMNQNQTRDRRAARRAGLLAGLAAWVLLLLAGGEAAAAVTQRHAGNNLLASVASGGRIYDNWMRELAERKPAEPHPLYPKQGPFAGDPGTTWRCVICHGWDYKGAEGAFQSGPNYTGIKGIQGKAGAPVEEIIAVLTNERHGYGKMLDEQSLIDVANFVSHGQIEVVKYIDPLTRRARGEAPAMSPYFSTICVNCHGADGRSMDTIPPVGDVARNDPWQALHKMLNGHPGDDMPALRAFEPETVLSVLAFIQTLPSRDQLASIARGGKLYDNWAKEVGKKFPDEPHPAFPKDAKPVPGSSSWRCVECHGWDYKGSNGIKGVRQLAGAHPARILTVLADPTHQLDQYLKHRDLVDLANFISQGQIEMNEYIDPLTRQARGDAKESEQFFLTLCATCHGEEGTAIRTMPALGRVAVDTPWQALHKMLNGHPGDYMPAWQATMPANVVRNVLAKLQTLPTRKRQ